MTKNNLGRVYVVGGGFEYIRLFLLLGYTGAKGVDDADVVVFTGGEDVDPAFYGERPLNTTNFNTRRDEREKEIFTQASKDGIPMVGICRGSQFLNVMNGGKLYQHVTNHCNNHKAFVQVAPMDKNNKPREITVTSTHHQMMIPTDKAIILLTAHEAMEKHSMGRSLVGLSKDAPDIEAVFYPDTNSLCFQPHPEFINCPSDCVDFFEECLDNWIVPEIKYEGE